MSAFSSRRLGILDVMILIAATAAGFALVHETGVFPRLSAPRKLRIPIAALESTVPLLVAWTPACLAINLRGPRPRWRSLARRPGLLACAVATFLLVASLLPLVHVAGSMDFASLPVAPRSRALYLGYPGCGVAGSWLVMAIGGSWRAEPTSIDRLGRALGVGWVLVHVGSEALLIVV
jgi:hypothetical protein